MFIPSPKYLQQLEETKTISTHKVSLKGNHLIVANDIVFDVFANVNFVYLSFKSESKRLLVVNFKDEIFRKTNNPSLQMLKLRGNLPERSIPLQEILIDNDLMQSDRVLDYEINHKEKMLIVLF